MNALNLLPKPLPIYYPIGDTLIFPVKFQTKEGAAIDVTTNSVAVFRIWEKGSGTIFHTATTTGGEITVAGTGHFVVNVDKAIMDDIHNGTYQCDFAVISQAGIKRTYFKGDFKAEQSKP